MVIWTCVYTVVARRGARGEVFRSFHVIRQIKTQKLEAAQSAASSFWVLIYRKMRMAIIKVIYEPWQAQSFLR